MFSSLKKLIWIDAIAALLSGVVVFMIRPLLADFLRIPLSLLTTLSIISLCYACYSSYLARHKIKPVALVRILIGANALYALACVIIVMLLYGKMNVLGTVYLLLESAFVAGLAILEQRALRIELSSKSQPLSS
jgi:hypothetical protein